MFTDRRANSLTTRRAKQPWPKDQIFKILSLDGGGIKGVYTAQLLQCCEEHFCKGKPIASHFDMIAGTSTGGIIALGLGFGFSTEELLSFYRDDGRKIFPLLPQTWFGGAKQFTKWVLGSKLKHEELEGALKRRFGERLLGESSVRLVIPAFMMPKTEITVFKTDHHADFKNDHLTLAWKVARSTSAAPTYLKGFEHKESGKVFIDGGVWANNPVMVALVDVLSAYDLSFDQIKVFSVGTGNAPFELKPPSVFGGLFSWKEIIKAAMFLTTDNATAQAKLLLGPDNCIRLEPEHEDANIEIDDYDNAFSSLPALAKKDFENSKSQIAIFFADVVAERERYYAYK